MRNKILSAVKYAAVVLLLFIMMDATGCQLAQPEKTGPETDGFIGFHIVPEKLGEMVEENGEMFQQIGDNDRSQWVEYGEEFIVVDGFGELAFPRQILIGTYNEDTHRYEFPGKEGYNCFLASYTDETGTNYLNGYSDMTDCNLHRKYTDEGEENILKTALYTGTVKEGEDYDYILTAYRVFQMKDGTVYLDGTGNSYSGAGFTINERAEYTTEVNGKVEKQVLDIEFSLKDAERLERVDVTWFGEEDEILAQEQLPLEELTGEYNLAPPKGAAWAMIRQTDERGVVQRAVSNPDYNGRASHKMIQLDEIGVGHVIWLNWEKP